jgi:hypothetical protein
MQKPTLCQECAKRDKCKKTCKPVNDILWKDNRVMEKHYEDHIVSYPQRREVRFSEIEDNRDPEGKPTTVDDFSDEDAFQFSSADVRLRKTAVFIDRFFYQLSCADLADKYGVKPNSIVCLYRGAIADIEKIVSALDSRKEGLKAVKGSLFDDHQKWFLLNRIFGFSCVEVGKMFDVDQKVVQHRVNLMTKKYQFDTRNHSDGEAPIEDPPLQEKLSRQAVTALVEAYREYGLSVSKAAARIAQRWSDHTGRPTHHRAVESKYWKHHRVAA